MALHDGTRKRYSGILGFLSAELAPFPGRLNVTMRCALTSAMVIVISMALEVPELALSLLVVFYVTQSNVVITRLVGAMFVVGSTLAIGASIVLLKLTFDVPLIRIVAASVLFFGSVYLMRVLKIGIVFFIVAIVIIYVQSFVDRTDQAESLVRAVLWVWVAVNYPIVLAILINAWLLPAEPARQLRAELVRQIDAAQARLAYLIDASTPAVVVTADDAQRGAVALQKLLKFTAMRDHLDRGAQASSLALIATVSRIYRAASRLPQRASLSERQTVFIESVRAECAALRQTLDHTLGQTRRQGLDGPTPDRNTHAASPSAPDSTDIDPEAVTEMARALHALDGASGTTSPHDASTASTASAASAPRDPMIAADAWHNPAYARFALKTLLAVLICYVFYNATDWQGAHTIMLTCLIVALPSLGASTQRALLRIAGAAVGSLVALLMVVFVIPHLDGIAGLLLAVMPVIAAAAWVAAGSERIGYAGVQILFTSSLALFEHFGPSFDLTEIRDRMVAIALGVAVATLVQMSFWRETESDALRHKIATLLRSLGTLIDTVTNAGAVQSKTPYAQQQLAVSAQLADCEAMLARAVLEPNWHEGESPQLTIRAQTLLMHCRDIALASNAALNEFDMRAPALSVNDQATLASTYAAAVAAARTYARDLEADPPGARSPHQTDTLSTALTHALPNTANLVARIASLPDWTEANASMEAPYEARAIDL